MLERKEQRLQPKIGGLKRQAAVAAGSAGRSKSLREQAPAYHTSVRSKPAGVKLSQIALGPGVLTSTCCETGISVDMAPSGQVKDHFGRLTLTGY